MIEQQGRVIAEESGMARIEVGPVSGCSACDSGVGCGAGLFARLLPRKKTELTVRNGINAKTGEAVIIGITEGLFLSLLLRLYFYPLLAGLAGAMLGYFIAQAMQFQPAYSDILTLITAVVFTSVALLFSRLFQQPIAVVTALELLRRAEVHAPGLNSVPKTNLN